MKQFFVLVFCFLMTIPAVASAQTRIYLPVEISSGLIKGTGGVAPGTAAVSAKLGLGFGLHGTTQVGVVGKYQYANPGGEMGFGVRGDQQVWEVGRLLRFFVDAQYLFEFSEYGFGVSGRISESLVGVGFRYSHSTSENTDRYELGISLGLMRAYDLATPSEQGVIPYDEDE
ncbi:MAG: hypothetical protein HKN21_03585 [Candidatus Eisenbacteria bacterium]|uniref:Outer membrane protein beta-barrel domain-containing protein n=1 Tax=Eiseniibacteriota bacterium TaxID=2212470 RepID=A0A7Y2E7J4_UNCEI|nr:hypothetical protein [Candidatus Eisenbacteria bacterium]